MEQTDNLRINEINPVLSPDEVKVAHPANNLGLETAIAGRQAIQATLHGDGERALAIVGPCSIHDPDAALEYSEWLQKQRERFQDELEIVMRVYFEKPRTVSGWKGLINDPGLNESFDINRGLLTARKLVVDLTGNAIPIATELLDTMTPQYFSDLLSWGAIGARTVESQLHRELASGLSFPVGFKNGTGGDTQVAVDAVRAASMPHHFLAITSSGMAAIASTAGNSDCHVVLRGGKNGPNYDPRSIEDVCKRLNKAGMRQKILIDASHANSGKDHNRQPSVISDVADMIALGNKAIMGVMIESNLVSGNQPFNPGGNHEYGISVTDACSSLEDTSRMLETIAKAVSIRKTS